MTNIKINESIAVLRKKAGITQDELANELGVSNQAVSKWESGKCCPDIELIPNIASFFGVSIDELVLGKYVSHSKTTPVEPHNDIMLQAIKIAQKQQRIYTAILQRKLKIGFDEANKLIEDMYRCGYITKNASESTDIYLYNNDIE